MCEIPENLDNIEIKTEPEDTGYDEYILLNNDIDIKVEIKEEIDSDGDTQDDSFSFSPASSTPLSPDSTCKVEILEQPIKKVRFRYLSELQGTPHGPILGEKHTKNSKTFPKVRLIGYEGQETVKMRCWLVDKAEMSKGLIRPHCHDLAVRKCNAKSEIVMEPHEVVISRKNNYTATFDNMVVLHNVQKNSEVKYFHKEMTWNSRDSVTSFNNSRMNKKKIQDTIKSINKNEVYLYFEAFIEYRNSVQILCWALSHAIKNLKHPYSGDLKIVRVLNNFGPCDGNTEICLFTEKVPSDVKVKFFNPETKWEVCVNPEFMHKNMALTLRTPQYPFCFNDDVKVHFCLLREADGVESNSVDFTYQAPEYNINVLNRNKRKRMAESHAQRQIHRLDNIMIYHEESSSDQTTIEGDILGLLGNVEYDEITENLGQEIKMEDIQDDKLIQFIDSNVNHLANWSGSSLEEALGVRMIRNENITPRIEADGPLHHSTVIKEGDGNPIGGINSCNLKSGSLEERIVRDILLTSLYKNHVNCLQKAVKLNQVDGLQQLLSSVNRYTKWKEGDKQFKHLFSSLPKFITKIRNEKFQTVLHETVLLKRFNMIPHLLEFGFDPLAKDREGNNSFHLSVKSKSLSTLNSLVELCFESQRTNMLKQYPHSVLMLPNFEGQNILHLAVRVTDCDLVNFIVKLKDFNINSLEKNSGDTPLHIACRLQLPHIAIILLQNGADTRTINLQGFAPLHISVASNDYEMASLLIKEKSDPSQECISLTRDLREESFFDDETTSDERLEESECYPTSNAFSLALDLMMLDILKGDASKLKVVENGPPDETIDENINCLLTSEKIVKLSALLKEKNMWKDVAKKLNKSHIETLCKNFDQPEVILLSYIEQYKKEIFGECNQLEQLSDIFSSLDLTEAKEILGN